MAIATVDWLSSLPISFVEVVSIVSVTFPQCLEYVNGEVTTIDCLSSVTQLRKQPFDFSRDFSHLEFCQVLPRPSGNCRLAKPNGKTAGFCQQH
jgi:hypothetical protein